MGLLLKNISLPLAPFTLRVDAELTGRITVLFGPSGAGKTSLLDLIAGLRRAKTGLIQLDNRVLTDISQKVAVPTRQRGIGYVPQDLALFPHLSVRQNLLYGHKSRDRSEQPFTLERIVEVLEIQALIQRAVTNLSGGEKQRVVLARALLASPRLLLLDEPLASLDLELKARIIPYLARIRDEFHLPMLYVTHDRYETIALADEVMVLAQGRVVQLGSVQEVFSRPALVGCESSRRLETVQPGRVLNAETDLVTVEVGSTILSAVREHLPGNSKAVRVCIRAEDVILIKGRNTPSSARNHLPAIVQSIAPEGMLMRVDLSCGFPLVALVTRQACEEMSLKSGDAVTALVKAPNVHLVSR